MSDAAGRFSKWIPTAPEVVREGLIVLAGAALAALAFQLMPGFRAWVAARVPTQGPPP